MKLTDRELWLMREAFYGSRFTSLQFDRFLAERLPDGATSTDAIADAAPADTAVAAAVEAEREACASQIDVRASELYGLSDGCSLAAECMRTESKRIRARGKS